MGDPGSSMTGGRRRADGDQKPGSAPAPRRCRCDGPRAGDDVLEQGPLSSPIINALEKFIGFCKVERAAFRERAMMTMGTHSSGDLHDLKEKILQVFGDSLDSECIDHVCQAIYQSTKNYCLPCKGICDQMAIDIMKIVFESLVSECLNDDNIPQTTHSDTVLVSAKEEVSETSAGSVSNGNNSSDIGKPVNVCLDTPLVNAPILKNPSASKSIPVFIHPLNRRGIFARRDKLGLFPRTSLTSPKGLFDLHISDSECEDEKDMLNEQHLSCAVDVPRDTVPAPTKSANPNAHVTSPTTVSQPPFKENPNPLATSMPPPSGDAIALPKIPDNKPTVLATKLTDLASTVPNIIRQKRLRELVAQDAETSFSKSWAVKTDHKQSGDCQKVSSHCVALAEATVSKGQHAILPSSHGPAFLNSLHEPTNSNRSTSKMRSIYASAPKKVKWGLYIFYVVFTTFGTLTGATSNGSSRSRAAELVDQLYNHKNVFTEDYDLELQQAVHEPSVLNK